MKDEADLDKIIKRETEKLQSSTKSLKDFQTIFRSDKSDQDKLAQAHKIQFSVLQDRMKQLDSEQIEEKLIKSNGWHYSRNNIIHTQLDFIDPQNTPIEHIKTLNDLLSDFMKYVYKNSPSPEDEIVQEKLAAITQKIRSIRNHQTTEENDV